MAKGVGSIAGLIGRDDECEALDRLADDVVAGASRGLVLRGEPGVGKIFGKLGISSRRQLRGATLR